MPNFTVTIFTGSDVAWVDPAIASQPSRLNAFPLNPHTYRKVSVGLGPVVVTLKATVGGVLAPMDAALGGKLFSAAFAEGSGVFPPPITLAAAQSSLATFTVTSSHLGHFLFSFRRKNGGAVNVPFDVEI